MSECHVTGLFLFHIYTSLHSLERGLPLTHITLSSKVLEVDKCNIFTSVFCVPARVFTRITRSQQDPCSSALSKPILYHQAPSVPSSLHLFGDNQVTELIIFNSILLLAGLRVIRDVWGASRPCHQGLSSVIACRRLPERKSCSHNHVADGIPRWPRRAPPSFPKPPPPHPSPCRPHHGIRLGMLRQERGNASKDAWQGCHLDAAAPEHCVNGVL